MHLSVEIHQLYVQPYAVMVLQFVRDKIHTEVITLLYGVDQDGGKRPLRLIHQRLPIAVVVDARPRHHWPTVVQLPEETAHAVRSVAAVSLDAVAYALPLQHQSNVHQVFKPLRHPVVQSHSLLDKRIAYVGFLMRIHYRRLQFKVFLFGERAYRLHLGERLETVFAHEARHVRVEALERLASMPCAPVVAVGSLPTVGASPVGFVGRAVHIESAVVEPLHHLRQQLTEQHVVSTLHLGKSLGRVFSLPSPIAHSLIYLVVAAPHGKRRMSAQTLYVVFCLALHPSDE